MQILTAETQRTQRNTEGVGFKRQTALRWLREESMKAGGHE
jgi:hypothetical protein